MGCIYLITNLVNGKYYVGKTEYTAQKRWREHVCSARAGSPYRFHAAIRKYGSKSFCIQEVAAADKHALDVLERLWILVLDSVRTGYNLTYGGDGGVADTVKERHAASMRAVMVGNCNGRGNRGKQRTAEQRLHISAGRIGKSFHPWRGIKFSAAARERMRQGQQARREKEAANG